jgi:hypothetical protein
MPEFPSAGFLSMLESYGLRFTRILMIPDLSNFCALWVNAKVVGGMLGLEVCQQAFVPGLQWPKRVLDLVLTLIGGVLILPLLGLIALAILIDSRGPRVLFAGAHWPRWKNLQRVEVPIDGAKRGRSARRLPGSLPTPSRGMGARSQIAQRSADYARRADSAPYQHGRIAAALERPQR